MPNNKYLIIKLLTLNVSLKSSFTGFILTTIFILLLSRKYSLKILVNLLSLNGITYSLLFIAIIHLPLSKLIKLKKKTKI